MKKSGIALLAILLCLGGMTPMVFAEEVETEPEEVTVEEVRDEVTDEAEEADSNNAEETIAEEEEIVEEAVQEESAEKAAEEEKQTRTGYEVLPTEHGSVRVQLWQADLYHQGYTYCWKITYWADLGYDLTSLKAFSESGVQRDTLLFPFNNVLHVK